MRCLPRVVRCGYYDMLQEAERLFGVARPGGTRSQEQAGPSKSDTGGQPGVADLLGMAQGLPGSEDGEETTAVATDSGSDGTGARLALPKSWTRMQSVAVACWGFHNRLSAC